ncbi:zinc ribbon domain-containing protein [Konateibacter massiliensis]|uniref:zinc ribbon domain-containing protein n=1 Tax=Konateibacter massiliensis TaxID=2002841 RepID=UPI000C14AB5E|nr:zinc ribbon domain-containing protein [Konateibacter massiliensis]
MAFFDFDKLGETISAKSKDVAKKAKQVAEITSLNGKIGTQEDIIRRTYLEIGQKYYEQHKQDTSSEFGAECEVITEALDEIARIKSEIQLLKNCKVCPKCGAEVSYDAIFCSSCGSQFEIVNEEDGTEEAANETAEEKPEFVEAEVVEEENLEKPSSETQE